MRWYTFSLPLLQTPGDLIAGPHLHWHVAQTSSWIAEFQNHVQSLCSDLASLWTSMLLLLSKTANDITASKNCLRLTTQEVA